MHKPTIKIEDKFVKLTVVGIEHLYTKSGSKRGRLYECLCECGRVRKVKADLLISGSVRSCGCDNYNVRHSNTKYSPQESSYRAKAANYKAQAKIKKREFTLTFEQCIELFKSNCYYCGAPPSNTYNLVERNRKYTGGMVYCLARLDNYTIKYSGIDRKNPDLGYTPLNCLPCCFRCNWAKSDYSYDEFISWIDTLTKFRENK